MRLSADAGYCGQPARQNFTHAGRRWRHKSTHGRHNSGGGALPGAEEANSGIAARHSYTTPELNLVQIFLAVKVSPKQVRRAVSKKGILGSKTPLAGEILRGTGCAWVCAVLDAAKGGALR